jgi:cell division septation protein DedD
MKNSMLIWIFIVGIVVAVLFAFNYQGNRNAIPLSEIFPEEKTLPTEVEYEFVDQETPATQTPAAQTAPEKAPAAASQPASIVSQVVDTAKVSVPASVQETLAQTDPAKIPFTIQIASFKTKEAAQDSLKKVIAKGYKGYIVSKNLGDKGTWHRVYIGAFENLSAAKDELTKVQKDYPGSFVIVPK